MRFQDKVTDTQELDNLLFRMSSETESCYLWTHLDGKIAIFSGRLIRFDQTENLIEFHIDRNSNRNALNKVESLNIFHESMLIIFRAKKTSLVNETLQLDFPLSILKLAQSEESESTEASGMDQSDLKLLTEVLEVINTQVTPPEQDDSEAGQGPTYVFAKKPEIKETTSQLSFSNKGVVESDQKNQLEESVKKKNRVLLGKKDVEPSIYQLIELETHKIVFHTLVKGEYKMDDEIMLYSIYDTKLTRPIVAKVTVFNRPSEYAKFFRVEAKFDTPYDGEKPKKKELEKVGLKRVLTEEQFGSESLYPLHEMNTNGIVLSEKKQGEFHVGDKLLIASLYGSALKKPLMSQVKSIQNASDARLVTLEFLISKN